jgi:hypothetical protein
MQLSPRINRGPRQRGSRARVALAIAVLAVAASVAVPTATAEASVVAAWQPEAASYGVSQPVVHYVRMADGTKLWSEAFYPTNLATGKRAPGSFPVLLSQDPYGNPSQSLGSGDYYIARGYIYVVAELRGTASSDGQRTWFSTQMGQDGAQLVNYVATELSGSNGRVGLDGCSFLGVDQWFTAAEVGPNSALKAITPFCTDSNLYDDLNANGGIPTTFAAGIGFAEPVGPQDNPASDPLANLVGQLATGGPDSFDDSYWQSVDVADDLMPSIVANGIPAISETGWNDLFPGGNLDAYVAAQNAYFGRPLQMPISDSERVTGRYQAIVGNWMHGENTSGPELSQIKLEWFDTWVKGEKTGLDKTSTPLHVWEEGANQWVNSAAYPLTLDAQRMYLGDAALTSAKPPAKSASDQLTWAAPSTSTPGTIVTYTSAPLEHPRVLDGPTDVTVFASSTSPDLELTATLNLVDPSNTVTQLASGDLLGSQRAVTASKSWVGSNGSYLTAVHPFQESSQSVLAPGQTYEFDIALLSRFQLIPAGDSLQIVLTSQAPPTLLAGRAVVPTPEESAALAGGVYTIDRSSAEASFVNLPLAPVSTFTASPVSWGPAS